MQEFEKHNRAEEITDPFDDARKRRLKTEAREAKRLADGFALLSEDGSGDYDDEDTDD